MLGDTLAPTRQDRACIRIACRSGCAGRKRSDKQGCKLLHIRADTLRICPAQPDLRQIQALAIVSATVPARGLRLVSCIGASSRQGVAPTAARPVGVAETMTKAPRSLPISPRRRVVSHGDTEEKIVGNDLPLPTTAHAEAREQTTRGRHDAPITRVMVACRSPR